jgi:hypothetical protein
LPKKKDKDPAEFFRGKLREKDKLIRSLEKRIKELEKHLQPQDNSEVIADTEDTIPKLQMCDSESCNKGVMREFEIIGKIYGECVICGNRKRLR